MVPGVFLEKNLVSRLVFLGVPAGRDAGEVAEGADEVGVVGETGALTGLLDADALLQELAGPENTAVDDIFHDGEPGGRLENAAQVVFADIEAAGDLIQGEGLGEVVPDIVQDGGHPKKILVADGLAGGGGVEGGGHPEQQIEQSHRLPHITAEGTVIFIALQGLEKLNDLGHGPGVQGGAAEGVLGQVGEIGLGGGQLHQGFAADVQDVAGMEAGGHGAVKGVFSNEIQGAPAQGVYLVVDKNIARTGQRQKQFVMVMEMEPAHIPGVVVI